MFFAVVLATGLLSYPSAQALTMTPANEPQTDAEIQVTIYQVDPSRLVAIVGIVVSIWSDSFLGNTTTVAIMGTGFVVFDLRTPDQPDAERTSYYYQGSTGILQWAMFGVGEVYPFDHYAMNFTLSPYREDLANIALRKSSLAVLSGNASLALMSTWVPNLPYINEVPTQTSGTSMVVTLDRKPVTGLPVVLAILASYAFLGFSFFVNPKKNLGDRLTVCTSVFVLVLGLYFGLGTVLPYRSVFSILEVLFFGLIASSAIAGCAGFLATAFPKRASVSQAIALSISMVVMLLFEIYGGLNSILGFELNLGRYWPSATMVTAMLLLLVPGVCGIWANRAADPS